MLQMFCRSFYSLTFLLPICALFFLLPLFSAQATIINQAFTLSATIVKGCTLGSGSTDVSTFGAISFGNITTLTSPVSIGSSAGAGSVVLKCTPGVSVSLALDSGLNVSGSIGAGRLMKITGGGAATLSYQLYQDTGYSTIWGNGSNGGTLQSFTASGAIQTFTIYARLFSMAGLPASGQYSDTVTVTITY